MAQHDMNIANQGFPAFRADLNDALAALVSNSSGATAPSTTFAHQLWVDTAADPSVLKIRNADNDAWITIGTIDQTGDTFTLTSAVSATTLNTSGQVVFNDAGADVDFRVEGDADANLLFVDASADAVGIGTATPSAKLQIYDSTSSQVYVDGDSTTQIRATRYSADAVSASLAFRKTRGSFASPAAIQSGDILGAVNFFAFGGTNYRVAAQVVGFNDTYTADDNLGGFLSFTTRPTGAAGVLAERARLTSGGVFLVGATSAFAGSTFSVTGNRGGEFKSTGGAGDQTTLIWSSAASGNNILTEFATEASLTIRGSIDYNRAAGLTRYNTTSDATLKNILGDSDGQKSVEILNSTRIREFAWKNDETQKPQIGVIAQELHETFKGAVSVGGDIERQRDLTEEVEEEYTDEEGNTQTRIVTRVVGQETYTEYRPWGVDKTAFTFHLVAGWQAHEKMIQELKAINDAQASRIETLEAKVAALESGS